MVETIRSIKITVVIDSNKQTITESFDSFIQFLNWATNNEWLDQQDMKGCLDAMIAEQDKY